MVKNLDFSRLICYNIDMVNQVRKDKIQALAKRYRELAQKFPEAVRALEMAELPEMVYNSNAIENSTLKIPKIF